MKKSIQSIVFTLAHKIKTFFSSFGDALRAAWILGKLNLGRAVEFSFAKSTGEVREAKAVAVGSLATLDKGFFRFVELKADGETQWRSARLERMIF